MDTKFMITSWSKTVANTSVSELAKLTPAEAPLWLHISSSSGLGI